MYMHFHVAMTAMTIYLHVYMGVVYLHVYDHGS